MTKINVSNLQHKYPNGVVAVSNVNVEIEQGEQVSVVAVSYTHLTLPTTVIV